MPLAGAFLGTSDVANKLNMSERTLRLNLLKEDITSPQILKEVRTLLAREYATKTTIRVDEVMHQFEYSVI